MDFNQDGTPALPKLRTFKSFWSYVLGSAAFKKATVGEPFRGHVPKYLGRRAQARAMGYSSHSHMELVKAFEHRL